MHTHHSRPLWQYWLSAITAIVMVVGVLPFALPSASAAIPQSPHAEGLAEMLEPQLDTYTLNINVAPVTEAGEVTKEPDQDTYATGEVVTLTATANAGWSFAGWSGYEDWPETHIINIDGNQAVVTIADENKELTATFYPNLDVYVVGEGNVVADPDTQAPGHTPPPVRYEYAYNQVVTLTAAPTDGWQFVSWSGALTDEAISTTLTMTEPKVMTATFALPPVAQDGTFKVPESVPVRRSSVLDVIFSDPNDDPVNIVAVGAPLIGAAAPTLNSQAIVYTPTQQTLLHPIPYTDYFTYTVRSDNSMLQATARVTVHVLPVTDLAVAQTVRGTMSGLEFVLVGRNLGPHPADGAVISDTFPASLSDITWTCVSAGGAVCPNAEGNGDINETLATFPANGVVTYTVSAKILVNISENNTVTITPPEDIFDLETDNNSATQATLYRIIFPLIFKNYTP